MNFGLGLTLWAIVPMLLGMIVAISAVHEIGVGLCISSNPIYQAGTPMEGASGTRNARIGLGRLRYSWPDSLGDDATAAATTVRMLVFMIIYILAGVLFAWRAKCRFRRNIF